MNEDELSAKVESLERDVAELRQMLGEEPDEDESSDAILAEAEGKTIYQLKEELEEAERKQDSVLWSMGVATMNMIDLRDQMMEKRELFYQCERDISECTLRLNYASDLKKELERD